MRMRASGWLEYDCGVDRLIAVLTGETKSRMVIALMVLVGMAPVASLAQADVKGEMNMKWIILSLFFAALPSWADAARVVDTTPRAKERIFVLLDMLSKNPEDVETFGMSLNGTAALKDFLNRLERTTRIDRTSAAAAVCRDKESMRHNPNALADRIDADGERFRELADSTVAEFNALLTSTDRELFDKWAQENTDVGILRLEGNPAREGKVSTELVLNRACGVK